MEGAGLGLVLPVVLQRQYAHVALEVAVEFVPVTCPGYTALMWRWLDHLATCGKLEVEVVFPHQASALALEGRKPRPAHQCSDLHCQTPSTDVHQI